MRRALWLAVFFVAVVGCRRSPEASAAPPELRQIAARYPAPGRLVAIGDLHGNFQAARAALRLAGAVDESDHWIGGSLVVVQTGDQLDRGSEERPLLEMLERLTGEARAAGGAFHVLNGNHETVNVRGYFAYVKPAGLTAFDDATVRSPLALAAPERGRGRAAAFMPGGEWALRLSRRDEIAVVGDSVFVHGGLLPQHVERGIDRINSEIRDWMSGKRPDVPAVVTDDTSPLRTRIYGSPEVTSDACAKLDWTLAALGVKRLVVGHTIQEHISPACGGKVWRIDVALGGFMGPRDIEVLQIEGGQVRALHAPRPASAVVVPTGGE